MTTTTDTVWVAILFYTSGRYIIEEVPKHQAIEAGVEYFLDREQAQEKCNLLNCV
jgi:hypothetical protein